MTRTYDDWKCDPGPDGDECEHCEATGLDPFGEYQYEPCPRCRGTGYVETNDDE